MNPLSDEGFAALLAETNRRTQAREQELSRLLSAAGTHGAVRFERASGWALATPCPSHPGQYRLTRFDEAGAIGHSNFHRQSEAIESALREGYVATQIETL